MGKLPAFQFYPGDWLKDPNLRRCSQAARGVWMDLLCYMFECERRGVLESLGRPWTDEEICTAVGGNPEITRLAVAELVDKGVACRTKSGALSSRRLVRDEKRRQEDAERQRRCRNTSSRDSHGFVTEKSQLSSSSVSSSASKRKEKAVGVAPTNGARPAFSHPLLEINSSQDEKLRDVYPWVDRAQEYKKIGLWLEGNRPGRRVKNTLAFCQNWFNKIPCGRIGVERGEKIKRTEEAGKRYLAARGEMAPDPEQALRDRAERD